MRVLILIRKENSDYNIANYKRAIKMVGGKVVIFKDGASGNLLMRRLKKTDAILLPGGEHVTKWDNFLISYAIKNKLDYLEYVKECRKWVDMVVMMNY